MALVTWLAAWRLLLATWSRVDSRLCLAEVMAALSWLSVWAGAPAALSAAYCSCAAVTACFARLSERLFWATVDEYDARALASCVFAEVTWSFACAREVAVPPARSILRWVFAAARLASARRTASSALVSSATASTSPALTMSPTLTLTDVTGHVTVTLAVPVPAPVEVEAAEVVVAVAAPVVVAAVPVPSVAVGVSPKARS